MPMLQTVPELELNIDQLEQAKATVLRQVEDYVDEDGVYGLTPEEERRIDEAERRLNAGLWISGEEARRRINECLKRLAKDFP